MSPVAILLFSELTSPPITKKSESKDPLQMFTQRNNPYCELLRYCDYKDNELNQFNKFSSNRLTLLIIKRKLWS